MSCGKNDKRGNKCLVPTIVVAVLLVIVVALFFAVVFANDGSSSISPGNVVGSQIIAYTSARDVYSSAFSKTLGIGVPSLPMLKAASVSEDMSLSWWTGYDAQKAFAVSNMMPGDSETREYTLSLNAKNPLNLYFEVIITERSVLEEKLTLVVEINETEVYNGLLAELGEHAFNMEGFSENEITYKLTVGLPTDADNRYAGKTLKADFVWTLEQKGTSGGGGTQVIYPIEPTSFDNIYISGEKRIEGDTPEETESFAFVLEHKNIDGEYKAVGEAVAKNAGAFDLSSAMQGFVFKKQGLYEFRIVERAGSTDGMTYDGSEKLFQIYVLDSEMDNDGKLEIIEIAGVSGVSVAYDEESDVYTLSLGFTNRYEKPKETETDPSTETDSDSESETEPPVIDDLKVIITAENTVENDETGAVDKAGFPFVIENVDTGEKLIVLTDKQGIAEFELVYTTDDVGNTFRYKVYALDSGNADVEHSQTVYEIEISVHQNILTGALYATIKVNGVETPEKDVKLSFTSTYTGGGRELDSLIPAIIVAAVILIAEIVLVIYNKKKDKEEDVAKGEVKLNSLATPMMFLGLFVPTWQVVVLLVLVVADLAMLAVNIVYYTRKAKKKKEEIEETVEELKEDIEDIIE